MAVRIRLTRVGATKQPSYRVVVADSRSARDSRSIETLGHYNPRKDPVEFEVDADKAKAWIAKGALPSDTVARLFRNVGVLSADSAPKYTTAKEASKPAGATKAEATPKAPKPDATASAKPAEPAEPAEQAEAPEATASTETGGSAETTEPTDTTETSDEETAK